LVNALAVYLSIDFLNFYDNNKMKINKINRSRHSLPEYSTGGSTGMDIRVNLNGDLVLKPFERIKVPTGLFLEIPGSFEAQIEPRSGLAIKNGITILNSPGTMEADYREEVYTILVNLSNENFVNRHGEEIFQMVIAKHEKSDVEMVNHF
jgi:dUTP pyrophosphatase